MLVQVTDTNGQSYTANYAGFSLSNEATFYRPSFGTYTGTTLGKLQYNCMFLHALLTYDTL